MTKKQDAEPQAAKKPPYEVPADVILLANGLVSEICGLVADGDEELRCNVWKRAALIAETLRQLRKNADWVKEQKEADKK